MTLAHNLGKKAEKLAATYLINSGYTLLERNYRYLKAEVDLIVQKENTLVAVEVKARSIDFLLPPEESVSSNKIKLLVTAVDHYVQSKGLDVAVRFDLITYIFDGADWEQDHIMEAFYPFG